MKNSIILNLEQFVSNCKYTTLKPEESYKVFQNNRKLKKAANSIREVIQELNEQDSPIIKESGEIDFMDSVNKTFKEHYEALLNDETELSFKRLHWNSFDAFCKENCLNSFQIDTLADSFLLEDELTEKE